MSRLAISADNLGKQYRIGVAQERNETLVGTVTDFVKRPVRNFRRLRQVSRFASEEADALDVIWALRDVSFTVNEGEVVGIIGRNGAGKSTLLKILSRITDPSSGEVDLRGRVASLLEVGTGFHPELSGRENVYLNGTILGMTKREVDQRFDEIVDFSGIGKYIDTPVKRYSSGMRVRLAFSVAAYLEAEVLLIDEVLAVGDAEFQRKCLGKMEGVASSGRTVMFVSHNMAAVLALCPRTIWLDHGKLRADGETSTIVSDYLEASTSVEEADHVNTHDPNAPVSMTRVQLLAVEQDERARTTLHLRLKCKATEEVPFTVEYHVVTPLGIPLVFGSPAHFRKRSLRTHNGTFDVDVRIKDMPIGVGRYYISLRLSNLQQKKFYDIFDRAIGFDVESFDPYQTGRSYTPKRDFGFFNFPDEFTITPTDNGTDPSLNGTS